MHWQERRQNRQSSEGSDSDESAGKQQRHVEGGTDDEEYRHYALVDRVNTTMSVWMGTTMACAQCHNHKYDPFKQTDFYGLVDGIHCRFYDFGDLDGVYALIDHYIACPLEARTIADAGCEQIRNAGHTYVNRARTILETVGLA